MGFFDEQPELGVIVSVPVQEGSKPVLQVSRDLDDDWMFSCLTIDATNDDSWVVAHLNHLIKQDPSLSDTQDLPPGWAAYRQQPGVPWTSYQDD